MEKKPQVRDLRNGDWLWINKRILEHKNLNASDKLVYSALAYFANETDQKCYPSIEKLKKLTGLTRPTIIKAIRRLERVNAIRVERKEGRISIYYLLKITQLKNFTSKNKNRTSKKEDRTSKKEVLEQYIINNLDKKKKMVDKSTTAKQWGNPDVNELIDFL